ncbi:hypothetical protein [Aureivirga sp. CE67]|uniref:hypothetical protein n=1 Tax=Aureivirga sp. CE67 TaxID=1788983 RepID=UPI0018CA19CF|nr:hypothetical protein [Aureivirga sp. CE67]
MKKLLLFILLSILFISCQNDKPELDTKNEVKQKQDSISNELEQEFNSLLEFTEELKLKPDIYKISSQKKSTITTKKGTILNVNPANLKTIDNSKLGDSITVEIIEATEKYEFVLNNLQTVSNGKILESGGSYFINMTSEGKQLEIIKDGISVQFPKISEKKMELFKGNRNELNQMNWKPLQKDLKEQITKSNSINKITTEEEILEDEVFYDYENDPNYELDSVSEGPFTLVYYKKKGTLNQSSKKLKNTFYEEIKLLELGWYNIDHFRKFTTTIPLTLNSKQKINFAKIFLVFKDEMVVLDHFYGKKSNTIQIPKDVEVKILAYSINNIGLTFCELDFETNQNQMEIFLNFKKTTKEEIENAIKSLKN